VARSKVNYFHKSCKITVTEKAQIFEMIKLDEKPGGWRVSDPFTIPLPR
jgi:hypothetical protein